jgi:hypothetical protein
MKLKVLIATALFSSMAYAANNNNYVNIYDLPAYSAVNGKYDQFEAALKDGFDAACGDTWCEGDYANLTLLDVNCSVQPQTDVVGECVLSLAGTYTSADNNGKLNSEGKVYTCKFKTSARANDLMQVGLSAGKNILDSTIPGLNKSYSDILNDCLK